MTPDADSMGVRVWQHSWPGDPSMPVLYGTREARTAPSRILGRWQSEPVAVQMARVIAAAVEWRNAEGDAWYAAQHALRAALAALTTPNPEAS